MNTKRILAVLAFAASSPLSLFADGFIIPRPTPGIPPLYALAIKYHKVNVGIDNQIANTKIDQVFLNEYDRELEGTYVFPLPEEASISNFSMWVEGKKREGEILGKEEARRYYEDFLRRAKDPALLEYINRRTFKARVYPIPAHGKRRINIAYSEILKSEANLIRYVYPLDTERFTTKPLNEVTISIRISSNTPIKNVYSPTHEINVIREDEHNVRVSYEATDVIPSKDFILYYSLSEEDFGINLLTYKEKDKDGFFTLLLTPKLEEETKAIPKDITFVLDISGSMAGTKIEQVKDALRFCLNSLNPNDRFSIIAFNDAINIFAKELVKTSRKKEAINFVDALIARGGTDIDRALSEALSLKRDDARPYLILFLTDGVPTSGETNYATIINNIKAENKINARIFVFGVGNDVNTYLLDNISQKNGGVSEYVAPDENIEIKVSSLYQKISTPILTNLEMDFGTIQVSDIYPKELPDVFRGSQLVLLGRYKGSGNTRITLRGKKESKEKVYFYDAEFPSEAIQHDFIPRIWATRKVGYLLDEIRLHGENKELIEEIVNLSKEYGIMTPYTSFIVKEELTPGEVTYKSLKMPRPLTATGAKAIKVSQYTRNMKEVSVPKEEIESVRAIGSRTFILRDKIWTESTYTKVTKTLDIKYLSNAYFKILSNKPEIGKYLALGKNIILLVNNVWIKIGESGKSDLSTSDLRKLFGQ